MERRKKVLDETFINQLQSIVLHLNLSLKDGNLGSNRSKAKGSSVEFTDYREYIPGDDFRRIDWNALARFEKVFLKIFMEERESPVTVFVDKSKSMGFDNKRIAALKMAASFIYCALSDYNTVSTVVFDQKITAFEKSLKGQSAFTRAANLLEQTDFSSETNLYTAIRSWEPRFRKGYTVIISDFMYDTDLESVLKLLHYKKQKVILCQVLSDEEINPKIESNIKLVDSETNESMDIMAGSNSVEIYHQALQKYLEDLRKTCSKYHATYFMFNSSLPIERFLKQLQATPLS